MYSCVRSINPSPEGSLQVATVPGREQLPLPLRFEAGGQIAHCPVAVPLEHVLYRLGHGPLYVPFCRPAAIFPTPPARSLTSINCPRRSGGSGASTSPPAATLRGQ